MLKLKAIFGDSGEPCKAPAMAVNQQEVTIEKRFMVQVAKEDNACLVKSCDTVV